MSDAVTVVSAQAGDLAVQTGTFSDEEDEETSEDAASWGAVSETSSLSSAGRHALLEEASSVSFVPFYFIFVVTVDRAQCTLISCHSV